MDKVTEKCEKEDSLMMVGSSTPMAIKLKIPKEGKRVSSVCKKEFSSGKALGGHMRVHVMYHKNGPFKTSSKLFKKISYNQDLSGGVNGNKGLKVMINKPYLSSVNDEGVPTCFQCGKSFPSMKSLFGHMRCHPDRFWRGVIPPPNAVLAQGNPQVVGSKSISLSCNSNVVGDYGDGSDGDGGHVVDLNKYLKGWSVTERRGQRLKMDDSDEDLLGAVEDLMSLANSNANLPPSIDKGKAVVMQVEDHESKEV
nr:zinc finger C2H2-type/integrase DNA-binding domain-containing protein [Tanacetum cinerariifolium]